MTDFPHRLLSVCAGLAMLALAVPSPLPAEETEGGSLEEAPPIIKVEEDWEVVIGEPDTNLDLPQIVTVFGPTDASFGTHTVFELNHCTLPDFTRGGMQIQVWWGEELIGYKQQHSPVQLEIPGETIRYTTVTTLGGNVIRMRIENGTSETWGDFGGGNLMLVELATTRNDLNPYDPNNSVKHSRVTFGSNRVNWFVRRSIRFYSSDGLYLEDDTPAYVHKLAEADGE
jgi:hypothetical protein